MARVRAASAAVRALVLAALAAPSAGQATGASESGLVLGQGLVSAGGRSTSGPGNVAAAALAQPGAGPVSTSPSYRLQPGLAWLVPEVVTSGPIVAGARPASTPAAGGDEVTVFGFGFTAGGAGPLAIELGGVPATSVVVIGNVEARATVPALVDAAGNPATPAALRVSNALGEHVAAGGYERDAFLPAPTLLQQKHAHVGAEVDLRLLGAAGDTWFLALSFQAPVAAAPVPPFAGSLELLVNPFVLVSLQPVPDGGARFVTPVPDDPVLDGKSLWFQALSVQSLLGPGAFANVVEVVLHP